MGLLDMFRSYFPASRNNNERLGPNDLPSDVLNDLGNTPQNQQGHPTGSEDIPQHFNENNGDRCFGDSQHFQTFHDVEREFEDVFHQMDNMFKSFFGAGPSFEDFEGGPPMERSDSKEGKSLREKMLDGGDENSNAVSPFQHEDDHSGGFVFKFHTPLFSDLWQSPFHRRGESPFDGQADENFGKIEDQDLDGSVDKHSIDDILDSQVPRESNEPSIFGFGNRSPSNGITSAFKYSSVTKKVNPDGSVETTSKKGDSDGNEEVVVSRNLGEQTHTVTSKKNNHGEEEKIEDFVNMDQDDLETFDEKWEEKSKKSPRDMLIAPDKSDLSDLFSSWWKPKL